MSFKQLKNIPVEGLQGVSEKDTKLIVKAFNKKDLSKYIQWAQAIVTLAEGEE